MPAPEYSIAQRIAMLPPEEREAVMAGLDPEAMLEDWSAWARPSQLPPDGDWATWVYLAGRGAGKTRSASEWLNGRIRNGQAKRIALLGRTSADVRDVMVQGQSGLIESARPSEKPIWEPSKRRLSWPNGASALAFCVDTETRALTPYGWRSHDELHLGDRIRVLDLDSGLTKWSPIDKIHLFPAPKTMLSINGGLCSARFTDDHRWPVNRDGAFELIDSALKADPVDQVISAAPASDWAVDETISDDDVWFMAWWIAGMTSGTADGSVGELITRWAPLDYLTPEFHEALTFRQALDFLDAVQQHASSLATHGSIPIEVKHGHHADAVEMIAIRVGMPVVRDSATLVRVFPHWNPVMLADRLGERPAKTEQVWCPQVREGTWLAKRSGTVYYTGNSADEPDQLRGPQFDAGWCDEFASFPQIAGVDGLTAFDNLRLGLRLPVEGDMPRMVATTTPRRVPSMFKVLEEAENPEFGIAITRSTTYDNLANLAPAFRATILGLYEGTRIGQQELMGEMLTDIEGALFLQAHLDAARVTELPSGIKMHAVVGVDPSVAERPKDEAGIVVVKGTAERDFFRRQLYVVEDATVLGSPAVWAKRVVDMSVKWSAPVVAEGNQGGELVRMAIGQVNSNVPVYIVHAKAGKATRAEPVAALSEQGRLHLWNYLPLLESEISSWVPGESRVSPGRLDAMVWAALALTTRVKGATFATSTNLRARSMAHHRLPQLTAANLSKRSPYRGKR